MCIVFKYANVAIVSVIGNLIYFIFFGENKTTPSRPENGDDSTYGQKGL